MPKLNSIRFSAAVLAVSGLSLLELACDKQGQAAAPNPAGMATPVTAVSAVAQDVPVYLDEIGKTVGSQNVAIAPQVSGMITARHFVDGQDVKKDDLLFEIDPRPFQAQLDQAKGQLLKDEALKSTADWNVKKDQEAVDAKAISEQQMHTDMGMRDQAVGSIAADQAAVETARLNLNYCKIKSPIDGRAGSRLVDVGNVITAAGQAAGSNLLSIQTIDPIYADFTVTESELLKVQQFMRQGDLQVQVQLPEDAIALKGAQPATQPTPAPGAQSEAASQHPAMVGTPTPPQVGGAPSTQPVMTDIPRIGKLDFLDNSVQDGSGTVKLRATVPNADHHFWPGQFVNVRLVLKVQKGAVLIPNQATQISQGGPFVYTVSADSSAVFTPIVLGQRQGDLVVIEHGLNAGDQVVLTGQLLVRPQGKVMVTNPPPANQPTTKPAAVAADVTSKSAAEGSHS